MATSEEDLAELKKEIESIKSNLAALYVPKHFDNMMKKIGTIDRHVRQSHESMSFCFYVSLFTCLFFILLVVVMAFVMWKMNYFKFMLRQNKFGRFTRPRKCYACYRPWKKSKFQEETSKENFSSPELMQDCCAPCPAFERENDSEEE